MSLLRSEVYWQVLNDMHLKKNSYSACIMNDLVFEKTRKVLLSKQKELKKKGKGNRPNASITLTSDELNTLYEKGLLRTRNSEASLNTLWLNNTMHFGLRGCKEHTDMCWGDVKLKETADGKEYLEFNERQTKKQEPVQTAAISGQWRLKCLPLMDQKKIL